MMDSSTTPTLELSHVTVNYRQNPLFSDFSLRIPAGQCVCLLGQSGIGKSTLLRLIAGLNTHTDEYCSFSLTASDQKPVSDRISYLSQNDSLLPWLTVMDNIVLGYRLRNVSQSPTLTKEIEALLETVGLTNIQHLYPAMLSCGMRQRVALIRTAVENRPIILMDEPFASLDIVNRYRLQDWMVQLFSGRTLLFVTHDPLEALRVGHVIYILSGSPASISEPLYPKGTPPRDSTQESLLQAYAYLLKQLQTHFVEIKTSD